MDHSAHWFKVQQIADKVWAIDDNGRDTLYLLAGNEKALLIDTGWGFGNLKQLVGSLTNLPLLVVNTHGHLDHSGGNYEFPEIYIAREDIPLLHISFREEAVAWIQEHIFHNTTIPVSLPHFWATKESNQVIPIQDGHIFDLGERQVKVIAMPGHTKGCIGLLDEKEKMLFTGDAILNGATWLHLTESASLKVFLESLQRTYSLVDHFESLLPGHGPTPVSKAILPELIQGVTAILNREIKGKHFHSFLGDGLLAEFNGCSVIYSEKNL